ncbi:MAG: YncE family protein [Verrucomicrobia bacterium]|nr:YncE family protein [Verrucomicrobiota bacterium]
MALVFILKKNIFCITCSNSNKIIIYKIDSLGSLKEIQTLSNPSAQLKTPQHAIFSPDGEKIVVTNWDNEKITIYQRKKKDLYYTRPSAVLSCPSSLSHYKAHAIAISPCGHFLAVAYGASSFQGKAIALFELTEKKIGYHLISALYGPEQLSGIPKGITFSPDGACLLVTFSDENSIAIFDIDQSSQQILETPRQIIQGLETEISRPEDLKITPDQRYVAVTNSDQDTVTFYPFDKTLNQITAKIPSYVLKNPEANLCFPHGIAFSPDGAFMAVSEFGNIQTIEGGDLFWDNTTKPSEAKVHLYKMLKP